MILYTYRSELVRVIDGDTVIVNLDLGFDTWVHMQHIRLRGVDTAEMRGGTPATKALALKAKERVIEVLTGKEIILRTGKGKNKTFDRWVADVYYRATEDEAWASLADLLLEENLAKVLLV